MNSRPIQDIVLEVVRERVMDPPRELSLNTTLGVGGLEFDSIAYLELILEIEERTGTRLRNEDLSEAAFSTISGLVDYIVQIREV